MEAQNKTKLSYLLFQASGFHQSKYYMYFSSFNNNLCFTWNENTITWYIIYLLCISLRMFPFFITLWRSVSVKKCNCQHKNKIIHNSWYRSVNWCCWISLVKHHKLFKILVCELENMFKEEVFLLPTKL